MKNTNGSFFFFFTGNSGCIEKEHGAVTTVLQDCLEPQLTSCNKETGWKAEAPKVVQRPPFCCQRRWDN